MGHGPSPFKLEPNKANHQQQALSQHLGDLVSHRLEHFPLEQDRLPLDNLINKLSKQPANSTVLEVTREVKVKCLNKALEMDGTSIPTLEVNNKDPLQVMPMHRAGTEAGKCPLAAPKLLHPWVDKCQDRTPWVNRPHQWGTGYHPQWEIQHLEDPLGFQECLIDGHKTNIPHYTDRGS